MTLLSSHRKSLRCPDLIIFDFDGTLADTCRGILYTYHTTIDDLGLPPRTDMELKATIGVPLVDGFRMLFPDFSEERIAEIVAYYRMVYNRDKDKVIPELFPGVADTLKALKNRGMLLAVASSRSTPSLVELCDITGISRYFDMISGANETTRHKPDPEPVLFTLERLGCCPESTMVVGDMPVDMAMGNNAECMTVGVSFGNSDSSKLLESGADCVIGELPSLLTLLPCREHELAVDHIVPEWAKETNCAITVCDRNCIILYMNDKAKATFVKHGDLIGSNLMHCHNPRSQSIITRLLNDGGTNCYTISKHGQKKMIYQSAWRVDGEIAGLVEISMVIPEEMPHYDRG